MGEIGLPKPRPERRASKGFPGTAGSPIVVKLADLGEAATPIPKPERSWPTAKEGTRIGMVLNCGLGVCTRLTRLLRVELGRVAVAWPGLGPSPESIPPMMSGRCEGFADGELDCAPESPPSPKAFIIPSKSSSTGFTLVVALGD